MKKYDQWIYGNTSNISNTWIFAKLFCQNVPMTFLAGKNPGVADVAGVAMLPILSE